MHIMENTLIFVSDRIVFKIWTAVPRVEKYKIGPAVQIIETIRIIKFRDVHIREVSQISDY